MCERKSKRARENRSMNSGKHKKHKMSFISKLSISLIISIGVVLFAYIYNKYRIEYAAIKVEDTLAGLLRQESEAKVSDGIRIAVGFGSCQDIIVQSNQIISDGAPENPEHFFSITSKEEFLKVFAYFYRHGAAAERYISNATLFSELVEKAKKASSSSYIIGGNAPVMAKRFVKEGGRVFLGAQMSKSLQSQFPNQIAFSGPIVEEDDVHLLLEYPAGRKWGNFVPPRANRFIVHNDHQNPQLFSLESFSKQLKIFSPHLLVVGGLQMMDNFPMSEYKQREHLTKVRDLMQSQPPSVQIHFEMASFSDEVLLKNLVENVIPFADSLGMNEQELPNLYHMMKYGNVSLLAESKPKTSVILDQMRDVFSHLQNTAVGSRRLTRLHVHTLAFQAFMVEKHSPWKNTVAAAAKAALTANRHTCGSDVIQAHTAKLIMDDAFSTSQRRGSRRIRPDPRRPVSCWSEGTREVCVAPVPVCTAVLQTGGGGDNISSAGLILQVQPD